MSSFKKIELSILLNSRDRSERGLFLVAKQTVKQVPPISPKTNQRFVLKSTISERGREKSSPYCPDEQVHHGLVSILEGPILVEEELNPATQPNQDYPAVGNKPNHQSNLV